MNIIFFKENFESHSHEHEESKQIQISNKVAKIDNKLRCLFEKVEDTLKLI